jgi:hypothetical protein
VKVSYASLLHEGALPMSLELIRTYSTAESWCWVVTGVFVGGCKCKASPAKSNEELASVPHLNLDVHRLQVFEKGVSVRHRRHKIRTRMRTKPLRILQNFEIASMNFY